MIQLNQRLHVLRWCAAATLLLAGTVTAQAGEPQNLLAGYNPDFAQPPLTAPFPAGK